MDERARAVIIILCFVRLAGPFTQLVWSDTKELGVGKARSRSGRVFVVANYQPKGNVNGRYVNNVHVNKYFSPSSGGTTGDAVSSRNRKSTTTTTTAAGRAGIPKTNPGEKTSRKHAFARGT